MTRYKPDYNDAFKMLCHLAHEGFKVTIHSSDPVTVLIALEKDDKAVRQVVTEDDIHGHANIIPEVLREMEMAFERKISTEKLP